MLESKGPKRKMLVVDPSPSVRSSVDMILKDEYEVLTCTDLQEALRIAGEEEVEIVLAGLDHHPGLYRPFFRALRQAQPRVPILLLVGESALDEAELDLPHSDRLNKPFPIQVLRNKVRSLVMQKEYMEKDRGAQPLSAEEKVKSWLYSSRVPQTVRERIFKAASSPLPVFLLGEEGAGGSEAARAIHLLGPWREKPFLRFFCRQLSTLKFMESLSFWLDPAQKGERVALVLLFEEVESLGRDLQGILLDILDHGRIDWPGLEGMRIEAKVLASSCSSLSKAVASGLFRTDLAHLLATLKVLLPPLRERKEEIPRLVREILQEQGGRFAAQKFSPEALQLLQQYYWPGNLRELESLILRSAVLKDDQDLLFPADLVFDFGEESSPPESGEESFRSAPPAQDRGPSLFDVALSTLAHEIKNPLVAISTFAHLLPEKYDDLEFRDQFSRLVSMDVKRINNLLENLLEYAQFPQPEMAGQDLNAALASVLEHHEQFSARREGRVTLELNKLLPPIQFDEAQLRFVLEILLQEVFTKIEGKNSLRISTGVAGAEEKGAGKGQVELVLWYDGQNGILRNLRKTVCGEVEGGENLSLALVLSQKVMARNQGGMEVWHREGGGTTIRLLFSPAQ